MAGEIVPRPASTAVARAADAREALRQLAVGAVRKTIIVRGRDGDRSDTVEMTTLLPPSASAARFVIEEAEAEAKGDDRCVVLAPIDAGGPFDAKPHGVTEDVPAWVMVRGGRVIGVCQSRWDETPVLPGQLGELRRLGWTEPPGDDCALCLPYQWEDALIRAGWVSPVGWRLRRAAGPIDDPST